MVAAGYEVAKGDTWVLNEASSAVRRGTGNARANLREFLRGLYEGDGKRPTRGALFIVGVGQQTSDTSLLQTNLQNWMADSTFWTAMSTYVSDWAQEVYGDVRNYAVPGASTSDRRDYMNDYLQHEIVLANAGPSTIETSRAYLQTAFSPLANAAWERESGYGWTMVPPEQMAGYVSAQVYALRYFSATTGQAQDHWGFAWAPRNASGASTSDFTSKTGLVLDRLGAAIHDSAETVDPEDPGSAACGPPGQNVWCVGDLDGARLNGAWKSFRVWTQPVLAFGTPPQTIAAGAPSAPMTLSLTRSSGGPTTTPTALTVTLSSSSPKGAFSTSPDGPWSSTLPITIGAGSGSSAPFFYLDTRAGNPVLTASADGVTSGTQTETITPGPVVSIAIKPAVRDGPGSSDPGVRGRRHGHVRKRVSGDRDLVADAGDPRLGRPESRNHDDVHRPPHARSGHDHRPRRHRGGNDLGHCHRARHVGHAQDRLDPLPEVQGSPCARHGDRARRGRDLRLSCRSLARLPAGRSGLLREARNDRRRGTNHLPSAGAGQWLLHGRRGASVRPRLHLGRAHPAQPLLQVDQRLGRGHGRRSLLPRRLAGARFRRPPR